MSDAVYRNLPNTLTILRVFLAAGFFFALNAFRYPHINVAWGNFAIALFIAAAITDALDGYLARRWHVESAFGRLMDPFCDKILIIGAFMYLTGPRFAMPEENVAGDVIIRMATGVYPWMVVVILARELLVTGIRGMAESRGIGFGSKLSGKAKMIVQSIAVPILLLLVVNFDPGNSPPLMLICHTLVYATLAITVWSGLPYITGSWNLFREPRTKDPA